MAVKIRMTRMGRRHRPFFRINAIDSRAPRDGKILEKLGHYDPLVKDPAKQLILDTERVKYWLDKGAIPSDSVSEMLLRLGVKHKYAEQKTARRDKARATAKAKGRFFTKTGRIAAEKAAQAEQEKAKAAAEAETKPKEPQAPPAEKETRPKQTEVEEKARREPEPKPEEKTAPVAEPAEQKTQEKPEPVPVQEQAQARPEPAPEPPEKEPEPKSNTEQAGAEEKAQPEDTTDTNQKEASTEDQEKKE
ncbi:MAG TPA: 30S ribosomal protein S16 [Sedimentisphaerales bacterium]|nr:30S ribosomal protein S16 [Sedimentisphaerales bacterium]